MPSVASRSLQTRHACEGHPKWILGVGEAVLPVRESKSTLDRCPCEAARKAVAPNCYPVPW